MYDLVWTAGFTRAAKKFVDRHRDLRTKLAATLRDLENDPFQPDLRYHHLTGKLKGIQAVSITHSYRITLTVMITDKEIILLDIGSHDEVHR
ncbi:type II toxin-antitoxin system mRNA interferase toxin, RelE/StbE family [Geobacter pelophilus]|uniref:Type II toxin-antitoxin system mRNA interferase toxin, RelE/StbE family n=1 Tax=Geoanaerobacter pelophilus TaxID=60036 RepID=A0AAW4L1S0_9BACT|nr:type II toxin-antitoxin system mRNA interferase toxin, RelE/StbE family [Geoanaerobacter pelophilus]MBT0664127.1 type II toxin-antitoxin system mRNA interferase toxin, RelE/StbE family [Geoanaerobacter pelophilus]